MHRLLGDPVRLVVVGGGELVLDVHVRAPVVERLPELWASVGPDDLGPAGVDEELVEGCADVARVQSVELGAHGVAAEAVGADDVVLPREFEEVHPDLVHGVQVAERGGLRADLRGQRWPHDLALLAVVDELRDVVLHPRPVVRGPCQLHRLDDSAVPQVEESQDPLPVAGRDDDPVRAEDDEARGVDAERVPDGAVALRWVVRRQVRDLLPRVEDSGYAGIRAVLGSGKQISRLRRAIPTSLRLSVRNSQPRLAPIRS